MTCIATSLTAYTNHLSDPTVSDVGKLWLTRVINLPCFCGHSSVLLYQGIQFPHTCHHFVNTELLLVPYQQYCSYEETGCELLSQFLWLMSYPP